MAERRNYYEIINDLKIKPLPFDSSLPAPPDKIIQAAIEQWNYLSKLQGSISNESANSAQRRQELDMYEEIKLCFRDSKTRKVEADEMMKKQLEKLKGVIDILKEGSNEKKPLAPHAMIKSLADHLHLARPTVEKVFEASGFDMTKPEVKDINNILIASAVMENIDNSIRILSSQFNKACPWIKKGGDLYVLAAYYDILAAKEQSNPEVNPDTLVNNLNVASYQSKPAETLKNILHKASSRISGLNGDMWHEVKALCSIGESKIFSSNDAKTAYDNSLALKKLDGLFLLLKKLPLELKKDTRIAEVCIQKIQSIGSNFSDPDIARAIYNQKADLQDDPEAMIQMVRDFREGKEVVFGVRASRRTDTTFKRQTAHAFYSFQKVMGLETVYDHADYRLMSNRALKLLSEYGESNVFLRGIVPQLGLDTSVVKYDRTERCAGESKYPLPKMLALSIDGITSFSARPMRWIFYIGLLTFLLTLAVAVYVLVAVFSSRFTSPGWASILLSIWGIGSILMMSLGIVGEYIGKIFVEVKHRPRYAVKSMIWD